MKLKRSFLALFASVSLLTACQENSTFMQTYNSKAKVATFNLSFDRATFEDLVNEMQIPPAEQESLVSQYLEGTLSRADKATAAKVIQIRNTAAIIQHNRPDVLMLAEFNNDGTGQDKSALEWFQKHYLSVAQSLNGAGGEANLEPIEYPFTATYATNTGLLSEFDLDNNGTVGKLPGDAWGFGQYHGQYAFALFSKYEIDTANTRTFQTFKWKDMEGATNPTITICDGSKPIPQGMKCGDNWYSDEAWQQVRLSSKNHVDAPIIVPGYHGNEVVHLLMSHPTPPAFDTGKNQQQNAAEVAFWHDYVNGKNYFYDDAGKTGGLAPRSRFIMMGDQNLDPVAGDGQSDIMQAFHDDPLVNQSVMNGDLYPTSVGAAEHALAANSDHPKPNRITSTFGLGVDYVLPSANLKVSDSGVYWPASNEPGRLLVNDPRIGSKGEGKDVSSDHRLIWIELER
jgi:hypothetical protein